MIKIIGVRFRTAGKIYYFSPGKTEDPKAGSKVIVETARGVEYRDVWCWDPRRWRTTRSCSL